MPFIQIKPSIPTNIVRHPNNMRQLKAEGEEVEHNSYWERRLKDGDVVLLDVGTRGGASYSDNNDLQTDNVKKSKNKTEDNN